MKIRVPEASSTIVEGSQDSESGGGIDPGRRRMRRLRRLGYVAAFAAAFGVAACSSAASPNSTASSPAPVAASSSPEAPATPTPLASAPASSRPTTGPAPKPTEAMCTNSGLKVELGRANGTAGSTYVPLEFKNVGLVACWLYGYPGVSAWNGGQIGEAAVRDTSVQPSVVTLPPGATESSLVQVTDDGVYSPGLCEPEAAVDLKVYPPGSFGYQLVPDRFTACAGNVALLHVGPVTG